MSAGLYTAEDWARFLEIHAEHGRNVTVDAAQALKIAAFLRASVVAEEPEWEYGLLNPQAPDGGKLQGGAHLVSDNREHIERQQRRGHPIIQAVRRRKAGPWEPIS